MAFEVEDGTRKEDATAYLTVQQWKDHHTDRGITTATDGTYTDTEIQAGIVQASQYVDKRFGRRFRGWRSTKRQAMEWPRTDAYDDDDYLLDGMPQQLLKGTAEYALQALQLGLTRGLAPVPTPTFGITDTATGTVTAEASGQVTKTKEVVGPIEDSKEYKSTAETKPMTSTGNLTQSIPEYPQADLWIEELTRGYSSRVVLRG